MKPHFVKVRLQKDGTVFLWDDEGEEFHLEMRTDYAWPLMSRRARRFEMRDKMDQEQAEPKFKPFTLVKK
jgi:hypothetical protein